jgi:hypothetical protein
MLGLNCDKSITNGRQPGGWEGYDRDNEMVNGELNLPKAIWLRAYSIFGDQLIDPASGYLFLRSSGHAIVAQTDLDRNCAYITADFLPGGACAEPSDSYAGAD